MGTGILDWREVVWRRRQVRCNTARIERKKVICVIPTNMSKGSIDCRDS